MGVWEWPWNGPGSPPLVAADFLNEFFDLCFIEPVGFDDDVTDSSWVVSGSLQSDLVLVVRRAYTQLTVINKEKLTLDHAKSLILLNHRLPWSYHASN